MKINEIRTSFLDYFESKGHKKMESASLLPHGDPTLLFTTAGMVPFKDYFAATATAPSKRLVSVQKCLRTTDLEEVGKTQRHLSFFEMLGNFSFGDYFKKEAIEFAWDFSTNYLPFDKKDISISIYQDDDEAFDIWVKHIGVDPSRIVRLDEKDNFWGPAGETGVCGPCCELYFDRGVQDTPCDNKDCKPGCDCDRFMEYWNLVFNQFFKSKTATFDPLQQTGIDTGAGLERLGTLCQGVESVYETDELKDLCLAVAKNYGQEYSGDFIIPTRVISDHIRCLTFAMADKIYPSKQSRGYVLRRVLRRALLFSRRFKAQDKFMYHLVPKVVEIYGGFYPDLISNQDIITDFIKQEEEKFLKTLSAGSNKLDEILHKANDTKSGVIDGNEVFVLYDTYGFPLEMTEEIALGRGLSIDRLGFEQAMEEQKARGRKAWRISSMEFPLSGIEVEFTGYEDLKLETSIHSVVIDSKVVDGIDASKLPSEQVFYLITEKTPFYAEGGGQLGDEGIGFTRKASFQIADTQRINNIVVHVCNELTGNMNKGDSVTLEVNQDRRDRLKAHHSATHLLNAALREKLGDHVKQSGSLVDPAYLRFDFTHPKALTLSDIRDIEDQINDNIKKSIKVETAELPIEEAKQAGAVMTFGEKYGDVVRVVDMPDASKEFCGGTHVNDTAEIKLFITAKEGSPGAGNRRIDARVGDAAISLIKNTLDRQSTQLKSIQSLGVPDLLKSDFDQLSEQLKTISNDIENKPVFEKYKVWQKLRLLNAELDRIEKETKKYLKKSQKQSSGVDDSELNSILSQVEEAKSFKSIHLVLENKAMPDLLAIVDELRSREPQILVSLISRFQEKWFAILATTKKIAEQNSLDMAKILKASLQKAKIKGGGGGRKELAQGSVQVHGIVEAQKLSISFKEAIIENL